MKRSALAVTLVPLVVVVFLILKPPQVPWTGLRIVGLIAPVSGFAALTVARVQLGNSFSIRPEAHELVTRGIYSKIRNPIYVFSAIAIAGLLLYLNRPDFLWIFLILIPLQIVRARRESRVLEQRFGEAYRQYKTNTWF
jgi:protein-S-isoprenylcysteine O-methyltransferase Ste14